MTTAHRSFCWVAGLRGPEPQIITEPRVGCAGLTVLTSHLLADTDTRSIDELAASLTPPDQEQPQPPAA